jgi:hypothetical protein
MRSDWTLTRLEAALFIVATTLAAGGFVLVGDTIDVWVSRTIG